MPAIIDPSPYYMTSCRGNEGQCMSDWNADNVNDRWPLFYDNYFVPRGYAYVLAQMNGTGYTEQRLPDARRPDRHRGREVRRRLAQRPRKAYTARPAPRRRPTSRRSSRRWHNGSSAMIGKSYDGTLSNGVAATGVEGLKTIVPISAISAWYNYSRTGGVRQNTNYPGGSPEPDHHVRRHAPERPRRQPPEPAHDAVPARSTADINNDANVDTGDGDAHGDINTFWRERDYNLDASKVKASVFIDARPPGRQRQDGPHRHVVGHAEGQRRARRKLWLLRAGHEDPFDSRRADWVDTLHRWFDHYLYGVDNGIEHREAPSRSRTKADVWKDYDVLADQRHAERRPLPARDRRPATAPGTLGGRRAAARPTPSASPLARNTSETTLDEHADRARRPTAACSSRSR